MIRFIGNRPALQIGRYQVIDYNTTWLSEALKRAACSAGQEDFDYIDDLMNGIMEYLETRCSLKLLQIEDLYDRVRRMLEKIGCHAIAQSLELLSPPVTIPLEALAKDTHSQHQFYRELDQELGKLRHLGVEQIYFSGVKECAQILSGESFWSLQSEQVLLEIESFLKHHGEPEIVR